MEKEKVMSTTELMICILLIKEKKYSSLFDFYHIFGEENVLKFIDIFGGESLNIPKKKEIQKVLREVRIWQLLSPLDKRDPENPGVGRKSGGCTEFRSQVEFLANKYNVSIDYVYKKYEKMNEKIRDLPNNILKY